jgi:hypothetical protein
MLGFQPAHMTGDRREFPEGHIEPAQDRARGRRAQRIDLLVGDAAKPEAVGDLVHMAQKPRKRVRQRAVEIEDDEGRAHGLRPRGCCVLCCGY